MKTTTQPKKRGRPVGSKKKIVNIPEDFWKELELPDSEATVEQVKSADNYLGGWVDVKSMMESKHNYWKWYFIAVLLGSVVGLILSTPLFVKLAEVCSQ